MTEEDLGQQVRLALETLERVKSEVELAIEAIAGRVAMTRKEINAMAETPPKKASGANRDVALAQSLQTSVGEIATAVTDLTKRQSDQIGKLKKTGHLTAAGLALDLLLTVVAFLLFNTTSEQGKELERVQNRTSGEVLCPLYDLFLTSYNPKGATAVRDPAGYERAMVTIEKGAKALGCVHHTRGKTN